MRSEQSFAEKLKQRQAQQRRADAAREAETDAEFRARVLREMTDPVGHAAGAGLNAAQARRRPPPPGPAALPIDGQAPTRGRRASSCRPRLWCGRCARRSRASRRAPWLCPGYFGPATRGRRR